MNKHLRNAFVAVAVAAGGAALAIKKINADPELKEKVKESGKKLVEDVKLFGKSVEDATKDITNNLSREVNAAAEKVKEEADSIIKEAKEKVKEKEEQCNSEEKTEAVDDESIEIPVAEPVEEDTTVENMPEGEEDIETE